MLKLILGLMLLLIIVACGKPNKKNKHDTNENVSDNYLAYIVEDADLPECNDTNNGKVFYIQKTNLFKVCEDSNWEELDLRGPTGSAGTNGTNGADGKTTYVRDGNSTDLGLLISASMANLTVFSNKGYLYSVQWDGVVTHPGLYYTSNDCTGTPRAFAPQSDEIFGKMIYSDGSGTLYTPTNLDINDNVTGADFNYNSRIQYVGAACAAWNATILTVELTTITNSAAGIPNNIAPQISIVTE
jgi:hypothetical protein